MKALVLEEVGKLKIVDRPIPELKPGTVLINILRCGICSSDIPRIFKTGTYHFPTVPGHEFSGIIVDVAPELDSRLIGRLASVFPLIPCRKCESCKNGRYALCEHYNYFGSRCDGGFEEYLVVPAWNLCMCPFGMKPELAALCEPVAVAHHATVMGQVHPNDIVAVVGTGTIGLATAIWAKHAGASKVIVIGRNEMKLSYAESMGFDGTVNTSSSDWHAVMIEQTKGYGADVVLECVGSADAVETAILSAKKNGRVVITGNPEGDMLLKKDTYWKILRNELLVKGTWNSVYGGTHSDWETTIKCMSNDASQFGRLITQTFSLEDYKSAFRTVRDKNVFSIKVMLEIGK